MDEITVSDLVEFKGSKNGLIVNIKKQMNFEDIRCAIIDKLESAVGFFNGAKINSINCDYLNDIQIIKIKDEIASKFDVEFMEEETVIEVNKTFIKTKYVNSLRSGINIESDGEVVVMTDMPSGSQITSGENVVVMGNVESGAKIVAKGNIVIMGYAKGFIYAGANSNENAYAVANEFKPKVIQIANCIAESPDDEFYSEKIEGPEIAFLSDGMIIVDSYVPKVKNK
ncbi:MAG: septum site-determining protein MinC [Peptostreptococcaceae bacterium]